MTAVQTTTMQELRVPDVGTVAPGAAAVPTVGELLVTRTGGLPAATLDDLAAPATMAALDAALDAQDTAAALAGAVADDLHAVVPALQDDTAGRRAAIKLRRDVHNARWGQRAENAITAVLPALPPQAAERLRGWAAAMRAAAEQLAAAERGLPGEVRSAGEAMVRRLREPGIAAGLALASPEFTTRLLGERGAPNPDSRFARSATAYLTRAAGKVSPFSSLGTLGVAGFGTAPELGDAPRHAVSSARAIAVAALLAGTPDVVANPGLREIDGRWFATLCGYLSRDGFCYRHDEPTNVEAYRWVIPHLPTEPTPLTDLGALLGTDDTDPGLPARLLELGLLQPVLPWRTDEPLVLGALAGFTRHRTPAARDAVNRLAECEATVAETGTDPKRRAAAVLATRTAVRDVFDALGSPLWIEDVPPFQEMVQAPGAATALPEAARADLAEAARWLAPLTVRDPRYAQLVDCFVRRYGAGAVCTDPTDFLYAFLQHVDLAVPAPWPREHAPELGGRPLGGHRTVAPASHTMFCQFVADTDELVVNLAHAGTAGLAARCAGLPALSAPFGPALRDWVGRLHPDCRVYQFSAYPDWADLQRPVLAELPRLRCTGDLPDADTTATDLGALTLAHDPGTATLQAYDRDGCPVAFSYLGTIPTHLLAGPAKLLGLLSDPWLTVGRIDRDRRVYDEPSDAPGISFHPRVQQGRVVWARARWSVPAAELPRPEPGNAGLAFLTEARRWQRCHGLPDEVFLSQVHRGPHGVRRQKPQWFSFEHPHSVWAALRQVQPDAASVDLIEALPGRGQHRGGSATEFVGLVRHG